MDVDTDLEELETKIKLLDSNHQNVEFIENIKAIMEYLNHFDVATTETRISAKILPAIQLRFCKIFADNYSLFQTMDDELLSLLIKENLEVVFQLMEIVQELLNYVTDHSPVELGSIESILKFTPNFLELLADHWKNSSDAYKNTFIEDLTKLLEVMKHLYSSFLHLLLSSISLPRDDSEIRLLADALIVLCEMPRTLCDIDASTVISCWKCFGSLTSKYSAILENCLDVRVPIKSLTEDICRLMESLYNQDVGALRRQLKILTFLRRVLFKILTDIFYQQLNNFASELLVFYVRILSFSPEYYRNRGFAPEAVLAIESEIFESLDEFLRHLILGQAIVVEHLIDLPNKLKNEDMYQTHPLGFLSLLNKVLQIIADTDSDWSRILVPLIEETFELMPYCRRSLILDAEIFQQLIISVSASILLHDAQMRSTETLLRHLLKDNVFKAVLALEVFTLVVRYCSNIPLEERLFLLINLLYGVNEVLCGFFTHRPEMVHLKCLLRRLFRTLPDGLKEHVVKLFSASQHVQIWRFLGFRNVARHQIQPLLDPILGTTLEHIKGINQGGISEDLALNIAEGIALISTVHSTDIHKDSRFAGVVSFMEAFWSSDFDREMLGNNLLRYFVSKVGDVTVACMQSAGLDPRLVFQKLKRILPNEAYAVSTFEIISSLLNSAHLIDTKEAVLSEIADIVPAALKTNTLMQEMYLEMFKNLNESHNDILNLLLDTLNASTASQIFDYIGDCSKTDTLHVNGGCSSNFKHECLRWSEEVTTNNGPAVKRPKYDHEHEKQHKIRQVPKHKTEKNTKENRETKKQDVAVTVNDIEEDSSATEVIRRLRGEMKCLTKVCKTEKLTQKNVSDLRVVMSQISSLM